MKLHYYPETDSLYIELSNRPGAEARVLADGVVGDFDAHGLLVGLDIDRAAASFDLSRVETVSLPVAAE
jgi:uncharacterized protein YuzE